MYAISCWISTRTSCKVLYTEKRAFQVYWNTLVHRSHCFVGIKIILFKTKCKRKLYIFLIFTLLTKIIKFLSNYCEKILLSDKITFFQKELVVCLTYGTEQLHLLFYSCLDCFCARSKKFTRVKALAFQILASLDIFTCSICER